MEKNERLKRRAVLALAGLVATLSFASATAQANYPSKPVKLIVPSAAGGGLDYFARMIGEKLSSYWGQPVLIENRPGAGMAVGTNFALKAPADGYTLLYAHDGALLITPIFQPKTSGYTHRDAEPIAQMVFQPILLVAGGSKPASSVRDLVSRLRSSPGSMNAAYGDNYGLLMSELFKSRAKLDFVNVPYNGSAPAASAVMAGDVDFGFQDIVVGQNTAKSGRARILAITTTERSPVLPGVPTMAEAGVDNMLLGSWSGIFGPAGMPPAIVAKINADVQRAMNSPDVIKRMETMGVPIRTGSSTDLSKLMQSDAQKWQQIVAERAIQVGQ